MDKKNSKTLKISIVLIVIAIVVFLFWQKNQKVQPQEENVGKIEKVENEKVNQNSDNQNDQQNIDVSDWKTYSNNAYGFEFKYPKDWIIENNSGVNADRSVVSIMSQETKNEIDKNQKAGIICEACGPDISFYYYSSIENQPDNKYVKAKNLNEFIEKDTSTKKIGERTVGNINMIETIQSGAGAYYVLMAENNSHIYKIFFTHKDSGDKLIDIENKILSTYKITK
jgi:hypothetical protein